MVAPCGVRPVPKDQKILEQLKQQQQQQHMSNR